MPEKNDGYARRLTVFRIVAVITLLLGLNYIGWRCIYSLNWSALWFALPLVAAETYGFINTVLFVVTLWRPARRISPPPLTGVAVDVFITTYNEPVELVRLTVEAALRIDWPQLKVFVLDDGERAEMRAMACESGSGYITRGEEWTEKPRHAKAGNINNALMRTDGEFILILDADQIPAPQIVRRVIGYFRDPALAFVQTPQHFYNLPPGDPFGTDAPLFYGPIMQGKDGWNAAFFCGSNAILRREALLQLGLTDYVHEMELRFHNGLGRLTRDLSSMPLYPRNRASIAVLQGALDAARDAMRRNEPLEKVGDIVRHGISAAQESASRRDILSLAATLEEMAETGDARAADARQHILANISDLSKELKSDKQSLGVKEDVLDSLDLTRTGEAQPILPLATISITEDMATAMRLHALGWQSVFHPEILAYGLAPEDLGSALAQRLRWAQGTLQVMMRDNPLFKKGLSFSQRIQYFTTVLAYFSGFSSLMFLLSPIICLFTRISPVNAWSTDLLVRLVPYLILSRLMYLYVSRGIKIWRSEQYSLGLFPVWIRAIVGVVTGARVTFVVTPKQRRSGNFLLLVWPQITIIALTVLAVLYEGYSLAFGSGGSLLGASLNAFWSVYNITMLLPIVRAAVYKFPKNWKARPPAFLFQRT